MNDKEKAATAVAVRQVEFCSLDPDGDLILRIGSGDDGRVVDFKVCSAALRRASPVFKAMLFGQWAEAKPTSGQWIVALPDDDPFAFRPILAMVHGKFDIIPASMTLEQISDIVVITDKYGLTALLRPWAADWKSRILEPQTADGAVHNISIYDKILLARVAWELGCESQLKSLLKALIFVMSESDIEDFKARSDIVYGPPGLIDIVLDMRCQILTNLLSFANNEVDRRAENGLRACRLTDSLYCNAMIIGQLWSQVRSCRTRDGLLPRHPDQVKESVEDLLGALSKIFVAGFVRMPGHDACLPTREYRNIKKEILSGDPWIKHTLCHKQRARLAAQREKLGYDDSAGQTSCGCS